MKQLLFSIVFLCCAYLTTVAQSFHIPKDYSFKTEEDYKTYENDIQLCARSIIETPLDESKKERKEANKFLMTYLTGSPYISIELDQYVMDLSDENADLLMIFMAGWAEYELMNNTKLKAVSALKGLEALLFFYSNNISLLKEDKDVEKLLKIQKKGELENWLRKEIGAEEIDDRLSRGQDVYNFTESKEAEEQYIKGVDLTREEKFPEAIEAYKKALEFDPNFVEAHDNIAVLYRRSDDLDSAEKHYLKSIELYPNGTMAHQNLGIVYQMKGEMDKAISEYEILTKLTPENPEGFFGLARLYILSKDFDNALKNADKAEKLYLKHDDRWVADAYLMKGLAYNGKGDAKSAKKYIQKAVDNGVALSKEDMKYFGVKKKKKK